ncbi:hypothetical protein F511_38637 [Dorcoceras hygrometricum]|uniref:Uncharacterized protein n=1 Tax=Dorcoceras hygrometricum TaxID=472368 RepID=A0A2Z7A0R6_9LAMI|nr:hypothetical protein F511_38637 [Dorcoceras hygrometricum]
MKGVHYPYQHAPLSSSPRAYSTHSHNLTDSLLTRPTNSEQRQGGEEQLTANSNQSGVLKRPEIAA